MANKITLSQRNAFEMGLAVVYRDNMKLQKKQFKNWLRTEVVEAFYEDSHDYSGLGIMPEKALGAAFETDTIFEGSKKTHGLKVWGLALVIQDQVFRYDLYGVFKPLMKELASTTADRYNIEAFAILNNAFSAANSLYTDLRGEAIFSSSHSRLDDGTWDNAMTTGLSFAGFVEADILLRKQVNERGRYINVTAKQLLCSVDQDWIARTIMRSSGMPGTADNDVNIMQGRFTPFSSPYFTSTTAWMLWSKKEVSIWMRMGQAPDLEFDSEVRTRDRVGTVQCEFTVAVDKGRGAVGSTGAG